METACGIGAIDADHRKPLTRTRKAYSTALSIASTTPLASPNTIMVLSM